MADVGIPAHEDCPQRLVLLAMGCGLALLLLLQELIVWYRLRHIPGPYWMGLSKLPLLKISVSCRYNAELENLRAKYGPIVRIGPREVMISDAASLKKMSSVRSAYTKDQSYTAARLCPPEDNVFTMRDEEKRKDLKMKMIPGYSGREAGGFEPSIDKFIHELTDLIDRKYISTATTFRPLNWAATAQFFALDVVSHAGFGHELGYLAHDSDLYRFIEISASYLPVMWVVSSMPWVMTLLHRRSFCYLLPHEGQNIGFGRLMGFAKETVDARTRPGAKPGADILQGHINQEVSRNDLIQDVFLMLLAGSETVATALRMTLLVLLSSPRAYITLQSEIDAAVRSGAILPAPSVVTEAQARSLPYLQAVIFEALRLYPPASGLKHKQVPEAGVVEHGYCLPAGTQVAQNIAGITRNPELFAPDPKVFRPERWVDARADEEDAQQYRAMREAVDLVFGYGKYQCMGKGTALMELNKVIVELLRRYDFAAVDPTCPAKVKDMPFWVVGDFWVRVTRRDTVA